MNNYRNDRQIIVTSNLSCLYRAQQYGVIWVLEDNFSWYYHGKKERIKLVLQPNVFIIKELGITMRFKDKLNKCAEIGEISPDLIKKVLIHFDNPDSRFRLNELCSIRYDKPICICSSQSHEYAVHNIVGVLVHNTGLVNVVAGGISIESTKLYNEHKNEIRLRKKVE